jgi:hypothetical protein
VARALRLFAIGLGGLLYVWFGAVRYAPLVRARKAARRGESGAA